MVELVEDETLKLIEEIKKAEIDFIDKKADYELAKAKMWLNTDWATILNKARPTEKDKTYYIKTRLADLEDDYKKAEVLVNYKKRLLYAKGGVE